MAEASMNREKGREQEGQEEMDYEQTITGKVEIAKAKFFFALI